MMFMAPSPQEIGQVAVQNIPVKQAVGKAVGNAKLESEGRADKVEGSFRTPSAVSKNDQRHAQREIGVVATCFVSYDFSAAVWSAKMFDFAQKLRAALFRV